MEPEQVAIYCEVIKIPWLAIKAITDISEGGVTSAEEFNLNFKCA